MMPSAATTSRPSDSSIDLTVNVPSNNVEMKSTSHLNTEVLPVIYIQAPNKIPFVTITNPKSNNVYVKSIPSHISKLPPVAVPKSSNTLSLPTCKNLLLPKTTNSQQIVIQKKGGITNAYLTMVKPASNQSATCSIGDVSPQPNVKYVAATSNSLNINQISTTGHKYVIASMPKTIQTTPKLTFMPLSSVPHRTEQPILKTVSLNKLTEPLLPPTPNRSPITVMCDSNSSCSNTSNDDNQLICTEVIDLESELNDDITKTQSTKVEVTTSEKQLPNEITSKLNSISEVVTVQKEINSMGSKINRRKSTFCVRRDFDDNPIELLEKNFEGSDLSLTKADNSETTCVKESDEIDIEIKMITDKQDNGETKVNVHKMIKWENNLGVLPGSDLRFVINEFDIIEYLTKEEYEKLLEEKEKKLKTKDELQEDICCVECGCFGMPSDFINSKFCSYDCQDASKDKVKEKEVKFKKRKRGTVRKRETDENNKSDTESSIEDSSNDGSLDKYSSPWRSGKKGFSWSKYLEHAKAKAAPVKLFKDPFPYNRNGFKVGMKMEGIDPMHPSHFCVLTVAEIQGYRMRLHFDGYSANYDFWVNADSIDIFPMGWCEKHEHTLHPPLGYNGEDFNWLLYLKETKSNAAPKHLFANRTGNTICPNGFRIGMKLEAVDKKNNTSLVCVATVRDMVDNRILVHFDGWDDIYDYWAEPSSPYIHPVGWCDQTRHRLTPPSDYPQPEHFTWESYLRETKSTPAPVRAFKQKPACGFKRGMKMECVDRRLPQLIRVATVVDVKGHQIKIQFDGWLDKYGYWVDDDSQDIHPVGWCLKTGHNLEPPLTPKDIHSYPECPMIGCKGLGHVLGPANTIHSSLKDCPYSDENLAIDKKIPDRLLSPDRTVEAVVPVSREPKEKKKNRVGRPPKYPRLEAPVDDKDKVYEPKKNKKYKRSDDSSLNPTVENRMMTYLKDLEMCPAEKECWAKHSKFLSNYTELRTDPRKWNGLQVGNFIESLPTGSDYADVFKQHDIDGEALLLLSQKDIVDILKIKLGPAIKLYNSIVLLRQNIKKIYN